MFHVALVLKDGLDPALPMVHNYSLTSSHNQVDVVINKEVLLIPDHVDNHLVVSLFYRKIIPCIICNKS